MTFSLISLQTESGHVPLIGIDDTFKKTSLNKNRIKKSLMMPSTCLMKFQTLKIFSRCFHFYWKSGIIERENLKLFNHEFCILARFVENLLVTFYLIECFIALLWKTVFIKSETYWKLYSVNQKIWRKSGMELSLYQPFLNKDLRKFG